MSWMHWSVRWGVGAVALAATLSPVQVSAHPAHEALPDRIDLPDGWQPEGVTTDGHYLYVGSLADGAIWRANPRTGHGKVLAHGARGRVAVGVDYDARRDLLWVVGGATGEIRAHDADTGKLLRTYRFPSPDQADRFLNDLVVTRRAVFATDSFHQELAVVPLPHKGHHAMHGHGLRHRGLPGAKAAETLPLTGDLQYVTGFNLNGIVRFDGALVAVQSNTGQLFKINRRTGDTDEVDLGGAKVMNGDGLEVDGDLLYVVRNQDEKIAVVELDDDAEEGMIVGTLSDDDLDVPSTAALALDSLWVVNARFNTTPTPDTPYWLTRIDAFDD